MNNLSKILLISIIFASTIYSQNYSVGAGLGIGSFTGNFPSQTTFGTKLLLETPSPITLFEKLQFNFTYAQRIEKFLPGNYDYTHYSYFTSLGLAGVFTQSLNPNFNIQEGVGLIFLNDRSFNTIDSWNWGIIIDFEINTNVGNQFTLFANVDYGLTLNKTTSKYFLIAVGIKYNF